MSQSFVKPPGWPQAKLDAGSSSDWPAPEQPASSSSPCQRRIRYGFNSSKVLQSRLDPVFDVGGDHGLGLQDKRRDTGQIERRERTAGSARGPAGSSCRPRRNRGQRAPTVRRRCGTAGSRVCRAHRQARRWPRNVVWLQRHRPHFFQIVSSRAGTPRSSARHSPAPVPARRQTGSRTVPRAGSP